MESFDQINRLDGLIVESLVPDLLSDGAVSGGLQKQDLIWQGRLVSETSGL